MLGCCLIYFHFLWGKLSTRTVQYLCLLRFVQRLDEVVPQRLELVESDARDYVLPHDARGDELAAVLHRRSTERANLDNLPFFVRGKTKQSDLIRGITNTTFISHHRDDLISMDLTGWSHCVLLRKLKYLLFERSHSFVSQTAYVLLFPV